MRATGVIVFSGQRQAYADSELIARVIVETEDWEKPETWIPFPVREETARKLADALEIGYTPVTQSKAGFLGRYLEYFVPVYKFESDTNSNKAHTWEFCVITPFSD
jgi:hypothetical protein